MNGWVIINCDEVNEEDGQIDPFQQRDENGRVLVYESETLAELGAQQLGIGEYVIETLGEAVV